MPGLHIGIDVGGTKVLAGEVTRLGRVRRTASRHTPGRRVSVAAVEDALTEAVLEVADGREIASVGLAAAGFVDATGERVMFAPHLPWAGDPVRARLAERWGVPVALDNDANCAALAEARLGAARNTTSSVVVTLGTGIGGAFVLGDRVLRGTQGMAGEFGHMQVVPEGRLCECGGTGCWEQYCSGNALVRFARARIGSEPTALSDLCDGRPERLTGPMVTAAAKDGDPVARLAFASVGDWLGVGVAGLVAAYDPAVVVIGGGVSDAGDLLLDPARAALSRSLVGGAHRVVPEVTTAVLGPRAGLVGAALLARVEGRSPVRGSRVARRSEGEAHGWTRRRSERVAARRPVGSRGLRRRGR